jgi:hypothetical protein
MIPPPFSKSEGFMNSPAANFSAVCLETDLYHRFYGGKKKVVG